MLADAAAAVPMKRRRAIPFVIYVAPFEWPGRRPQLLACVRKAQSSCSQCPSACPSRRRRENKIHGRAGWCECVAIENLPSTPAPRRPPMTNSAPKVAPPPLALSVPAFRGGEAVDVIGGLGEARAEGVDEASEPLKQGPVAGIGGGQPLPCGLGPSRQCRQGDAHGPAVLPHPFFPAHYGLPSPP